MLGPSVGKPKEHNYLESMLGRILLV